jgi:hypothetical protein
MGKKKEIDVSAIAKVQVAMGIPLVPEPLWQKKVKPKKVITQEEIEKQKSKIEKRKELKEVLISKEREFKKYRIKNRDYFQYLKEWVIPPRVIKKGKKTHIINKFGYPLIKNGQHYQLEHRVVFEQSEKLINGWEIHHCDKNKLNNSIDNLVQIPRDLHKLIHKYFPTKKTLPKKQKIIEVYLKEFLENSTLTITNDRVHRISSRRTIRKTKLRKNTTNQTASVEPLSSIDVNV